MKTIFFSILLLSQVLLAATLGQKTYGEASAALVHEQFSKAFQAVASIQEDTLPHETKEMRKIVLGAREMMDLFAFTFDSSSEFLKIRDQLDKGYETIGSFKDLFDLQQVETPEEAEYNLEEVHERLAPVLSWSEKFLNNQNQIESFLQRTRDSGSTDHKRKNLSEQFWGSSSYKPQAEEKASEVLNTLLGQLWSTALEEYEVVKKIKDPAKDAKRIETYHDFRKRVRAALKVISYFTDLQKQYPSENLEMLTLLVESYGKISDQIAKLEWLEEKGKEKAAKKLREEIQQDWQAIQDWEKSEKIPQTLKSMVL